MKKNFQEQVNVLLPTDNFRLQLPVKTTYRQPKVTEAHDGIITEIVRYCDKRILSVGQQTLSGGEILSLNFDTQTSGNMYAEVGQKGRRIAIHAIVLP